MDNNQEPNYEFWDDPIKNGNDVAITVDLRVPFNNIRTHLESEGIILTRDDVLKAYDIYLRLIGLGTKETINLMDNHIGGINVIIGNIQVHDTRDFITSKNIDSKIYESMYKDINDKIPVDKRIRDIDTVMNNILTLFHEFTTLTNNIINKIYLVSGMFRGTGLVKDYVGIYRCPLDSDSRSAFEVVISNDNGKFKNDVMHVISNVIGPLPNEETVIYNTFNDEYKADIMDAVNKGKIEKEKKDIIKNSILHKSRKIVESCENPTQDEVGKEENS